MHVKFPFTSTKDVHRLTDHTSMIAVRDLQLAPMAGAVGGLEASLKHRLSLWRLYSAVKVAEDHASRAVLTAAVAKVVDGLHKLAGLLLPKAVVAGVGERQMGSYDNPLHGGPVVGGWPAQVKHEGAPVAVVVKVKRTPRDDLRMSRDTEKQAVRRIVGPLEGQQVKARGQRIMPYCHDTRVEPRWGQEREESECDGRAAAHHLRRASHISAAPLLCWARHEASPPAALEPTAQCRKKRGASWRKRHSPVLLKGKDVKASGLGAEKSSSGLLPRHRRIHDAAFPPAIT